MRRRGSITLCETVIIVLVLAGVAAAMWAASGSVIDALMYQQKRVRAVKPSSREMPNWMLSDPEWRKVRALEGINENLSRINAHLDHGCPHRKVEKSK